MTDTPMTMPQIEAAAQQRHVAVVEALNLAVQERDALQKRIKALRAEETQAARLLRSLKGRKASA